jgi:hypothetical protein
LKRGQEQTLLATGLSGLRAAAYMASEGLAVRVLCVGWDPDTLRINGPWVQGFEADLDQAQKMEGMVGPVVAFPAPRQIRGSQEVYVPVLSLPEQLGWQRECIFSAGGEVLSDVVLERFEVGEGRISALLTSIGRVHLEGELFVDACPRFLNRYLGGDDPLLAASAQNLRCQTEVRVTGQLLGVSSSSCRSGLVPRHGGVSVPAGWPGFAKWGQQITVHHLLSARHPWLLVSERQIADHVAQANMVQWTGDGSSVAVDIRADAWPEIRPGVDENRSDFLNRIRSVAIQPVGSSALFQHLSLVEEMGHVAALCRGAS